MSINNYCKIGMEEIMGPVALAQVSGKLGREPKGAPQKLNTTEKR